PVGVEQTNHFMQIFQVARRAGWLTEDVQFIHLPLGHILGEDGKKLKSRSGEAPRMVDLLTDAIDHARADLEKRLQEEGRQESEEFIAHEAKVVGISAIKYADLSQNPTNGYIFSYDKMLALQGNTAPYMLYAYVRVQGISRKGGIDFTTLGQDAPVVLQEEEELILAKHLLQLDEVLAIVEADLYPNRLCEYLFELSQKFNRFYDRLPILQAEEPDRTSRLILANITAQTLKLGLSLLGISVLERM
ncbi:arginine--tRNA ligase, partial [filamentous cyanobacterium CCP2]